jgi:hypothetical protein
LGAKLGHVIFDLIVCLNSKDIRELSTYTILCLHSYPMQWASQHLFFKSELGWVRGSGRQELPEVLEAGNAKHRLDPCVPDFKARPFLSHQGPK